MFSMMFTLLEVSEWHVTVAVCSTCSSFFGNFYKFFRAGFFQFAGMLVVLSSL
jgi:hypothetical protein